MKQYKKISKPRWNIYDKGNNYVIKKKLGY